MTCKSPAIVNVDKDVADEINSIKRPSSKKPGYVWVGPEKYIFSDTYKSIGANFLKFTLRPDDIFLVAHPRTGTTWTQEMIWLINNNLDFETAKKIDMDLRFPVLDLCLEYDEDTLAKYIQKLKVSEDKKSFMLSVVDTATKGLDNAPSPRFIKSHLPLSLLPPKLLDTVKVVYLVRDPRDVAVSLYHILKLAQFQKDKHFEDYWKLLKRGLMSWSPIFAQYKEAWNLRDHPNMLFLQYEDMSQNLKSTLQRKVKFFGKNFTDEQFESLYNHLQIEQFKKNSSVSSQLLQEFGAVNKETPFVRKGKVGGWRDYFRDGLEKEAEDWIADGLRDSNFPFYRKIEQE